MFLSELVAYATEKYDIIEDKIIEELFGFSVLTDSKSKLWIAVMLRKYDAKSKKELEFCDIKCGSDNIYDNMSSYIDKPFGMKGEEWVGVKFDDTTDRAVIFELFDKAVIYNNQKGSTISLKTQTDVSSSKYDETAIRYEPDTYELQEEYIETPIIFNRNMEKSKNYSKYQKNTSNIKINTNKAISKARDNTIIINQNTANKKIASKYNDTVINFKDYAIDSERFIPDKIKQMMKLYRYGDHSFNQKVKNFYKQGKFMEDYEDDFSWNGEFHQYFPTYNDMNIRQLRGYFSWRSQVRNGNYEKIPTSFAYLYLYELINRIGVSSYEEALSKMREFEIKFIESGIGDKRIQKDLRQWMLGIIVLQGIDPKIAKKYLSSEIIEKDESTLALLSPQNHSDEEIFNALLAHYGDRLSTSTVIKKHGGYGVHLFAQVWRLTFEEYSEIGENLFEKCFGHRSTYRWYPFSNAIYMEYINPRWTSYELNECRKYIFKHASWHENSYHKMNFNRAIFCGLIHEADRKLRLYLKTGHPLTAKSDESWASAHVDKVIEIDRKEKLEKSRPKITISFDSLEKIRQDALITMDSLLSEEEKDIIEEVKEVDITIDDKPKREVFENKCSIALEETEFQIISLLLNDKSVDDIIAKKMSLPEVLADKINEVFFEEIGDNVVECDLGKITLIEDYRKDVERIIKGAINE
ncbi:hypothetical protein HMPREF0379_1478 [[Eubacterium] yurii subsp. margaretiae ATCC 43715]|nr:hypothetical protein HMPREF0379_1478 [[Eubacterium] yurii subsp. margaretiae ATCC 43715]